MRTKHLIVGISAAAIGAGLVAMPAYAAHPGVNADIAFVKSELTQAPTEERITQRLISIDPNTKAQRTRSKGTVVNPDVGSDTASGEFYKAPEYTPDGKKLIVNAFAPGQDPDEILGSLAGIFLPTGRNIRVLDAASNASQCEYAGPGPQLGPHQYESTNGHIVFARDVAQPAGPGVTERLNGNCAPGQGGPLAGTPLASLFSMSPDGQYFAEGTEAGGPPTKIRIRKVDGSFDQTFTDNNIFTDHHPTKSEIVYGTNSDVDPSEVKVLNYKTGEVRTVVDGLTVGAFVQTTYSPDGKYIAYTSSTPEAPGVESGLYKVDESRIAGAPGAPAPIALSTATSGTTLFAMPDWGGTTPPPPEPPAQAPLAIPGAPGSGNQVCGTAPERRTSKKGTPRYTKQGLKIQQNIDSAVIIRLETINKLLDEGVPPEFICTGALGPQEFQPGMSFAGGGHQRTDVPPTPELEFRTRKKNGEIQKSLAQLRINEKISRVLFARAKATYERIQNLTGGNLAPGAKLGDRVVWQGLATTGAQPPSADAPATELEVGKLPKKFKLQPNAKTVRNQQRRSQASINTANKALDALAMGLTGEHFQDGSIGSGRF